MKNWLFQELKNVPIAPILKKNTNLKSGFPKTTERRKSMAQDVNYVHATSLQKFGRYLKNVPITHQDGNKTAKQLTKK